MGLFITAKEEDTLGGCSLFPKTTSRTVVTGGSPPLQAAVRPKLGFHGFSSPFAWTQESSRTSTPTCVPLVVAAAPGEVDGERAEEIEQGPGQHNDVVEVQKHNDDLRGVANSCGKEAPKAGEPHVEGWDRASPRGQHLAPWPVPHCTHSELHLCSAW